MTDQSKAEQEFIENLKAILTEPRIELMDKSIGQNILKNWKATLVPRILALIKESE